MPMLPMPMFCRYRLNSAYLDMVHRVDTELGALLGAIDNNTNAPGLKDRTASFRGLGTSRRGRGTGQGEGSHQRNPFVGASGL